jgi:hypothetical protein
MAYGASGGAVVATTAAAHAALVQAVKASGVIVRLDPDEFLKIMDKNLDGLVVMHIGGTLNRGFHYLTSYKGLAFYTKSSKKLAFPNSVELIISKSIWMPT